MASSSRRRLVVLDTNVLVHIADLHFDLFSRLEEVLSSSFAASYVFLPTALKSRSM